MKRNTIVGKKKGKIKKSEILYEFICRNPGLSIEEIAKELKWSTRNVKATITRLKKAGRIESKIFPSIKSQLLLRKDEVVGALQQINIQFQRLESVKDGLRDKEKESFEKCVEAQVKQDQRTATIYANHCAQIRDLANILERGEMILRRLSLVLGIAQLSGEN